MADTVPLIDGTRTSADAGRRLRAVPRARSATGELAAFDAATPNRFAFKHAHSQRNPEKDWGRFTLQAVVPSRTGRSTSATASHCRRRRAARIRPEQHPGDRLEHRRNGGGRALAAAELDHDS